MGQCGAKLFNNPHHLPKTTNKLGYNWKKGTICSKIRSLLITLTKEPDHYDKIAPKIEFWIEYPLREGILTVDELVEGVSHIAWDRGGSFRSVERFFREFRDASHRSPQAKSFVIELCCHVIESFAVASAEDPSTNWASRLVPGGRSYSFIRAASFVGYFRGSGLFGHDLVRRHVKSLINHYGDGEPAAVRANAIYQLFTAAGDTLFEGLLEPEDIRACFDILHTRKDLIEGFDSAKLQGFHDIHRNWAEKKGGRDQLDGAIGERQSVTNTDTTAAEASAEGETPVDSVIEDPQNSRIVVEIPPGVLPDIPCPLTLYGGDPPLKNAILIPPSTANSSALSISSMPGFVWAEVDNEVGGCQRQTPVHHNTFYFDDGNVEIVCEDIMFRVHSTSVSFSSPELREILSPSALPHPTNPGECPRINLPDTAEDFAILLELIHTPGFLAGEEVLGFTIFSSLLRMTTKYGFSKARGELLDAIKGAYPTKWDDFQRANVLGENIFGFPKPHPNAVLCLFEAQNVRFAVPFAAYRASIGGLPALMSNMPGTVLRPHTLSATIHGMHALRSIASHHAHRVIYGKCLWVCPNESCGLNVRMDPIEPRMKALETIYNMILDKREGGVLSLPHLDNFLCATCAKHVGASHADCFPTSWEKLTLLFWVSNSWGEL